MINELMSKRQEVAYEHLEKNEEYKQLCEKQEKTRVMVEKLYDCFIEDEKTIISDYYMGEFEKSVLQEHYIYIQGLKDGFDLLKYAGLPDWKTKD